MSRSEPHMVASFVLGPDMLITTKSHIFEATLGLRIKAGRLQQLWVDRSDGEQEWRDVPEVKE